MEDEGLRARAQRQPSMVTLNYLDDFKREELQHS